MINTSSPSPGLLIIVAPESPWPATHGARVDIWNRWRMLRALGWKLALVTWKDERDVLTAENVAKISEVFNYVYWLKKPHGIRSVLSRLGGVLRHSPHVWTRRINRGALKGLERILLGQRPAAVVLDSLYGALAARDLARKFSLPLLYRAHNIEHQYMPQQARAAGTFKKKALTYLASLHLRRLETEVHQRARWVFDISQEDLLFWRMQGFERISWLPPLLDTPAVVKSAAWQERPYDVVYLGNLNTPNNVAGLAWFLTEVLPHLLRYRRELRVLVAGSQPSSVVQALLAKQPCVTLLPNPTDVSAVRAQGRVLINPVLAGSGVNVKSVEMLFTDSPIVSTRMGVRGLSSDVQAVFHLADDARNFAELVAAALDKEPVLDDARISAREKFGPAAARLLSAQLQELLRESPREPPHH